MCVSLLIVSAVSSFLFTLPSYHTLCLLFMTITLSFHAQPSPNFSTIHQGLEEGKKYRFRVRAENMYGISEPLEGTPVEAKNPFDAPDAPEKPEIEGYSPSSCQLVWKPPANNGGRPVTGYIVEKRDRGGDWIRVSAGRGGIVSCLVFCVELIFL